VELKSASLWQRCAGVNRRRRPSVPHPAAFIETFIIRDKPNPFALSLSKGVVTNKGFDRLSPNGVMDLVNINKFALEKNMKSLLAVLVSLALGAGAAYAQDKAGTKSAGKGHSAAEVQKDIADHLAMAEAHTAAAKCLQGGKGEKVCHEQLARDCRGLGIGKLCGMKHKH
jgi:hypothetical protein